MNYLLFNPNHAVLTHIIRCKIDFDDGLAQNEEILCKICQKFASKYCEPCQAYFCDSDDDDFHIRLD